MPMACCASWFLQRTRASPIGWTRQGSPEGSFKAVGHSAIRNQCRRSARCHWPRGASFCTLTRRRCLLASVSRSFVLVTPPSSSDRSGRVQGCDAQTPPPQLRRCHRPDGVRAVTDIGSSHVLVEEVHPLDPTGPTG